MPQSYFEEAVRVVQFIWFTQELEYIHYSNTYSTYNAKDNQLKILAVEVLTHLLDISDIKKIIIIFINSQQSCFFRDQLQLSVLPWCPYPVPFNQGHLDFNFQFIIAIFELTFPQLEMNNFHNSLISVMPYLIVVPSNVTLLAPNLLPPPPPPPPPPKNSTLREREESK